MQSYTSHFAPSLVLPRVSHLAAGLYALFTPSIADHNVHYDVIHESIST